MIAEIHERVGDMVRQGRHVICDAGKKNRRDFACRAAHGQDAAGQNAGQRLRQNDFQNSFQLAGPEGEAGFAQAGRDGFQRLFGGHDDDRHGHHRQRERRPDQCRLSPHRAGIVEQGIEILADEIDEEAEAEQAEDNGRHARKIIDGGADDARDDRGVGRIFREINRGDDADGQDKNRHHKNADGRADDHREDAGGVDVKEVLFGYGRDEMPREAGPAVDEDVQQNHGENAEDEQRGQPGQAAEAERPEIKFLRAKMPAWRLFRQVFRRRQGVHRLPSSLSLNRLMTTSPIRLEIKVAAKSSAPSMKRIR